MMKNYLKTQENEFNQLVGVGLEDLHSIHFKQNQLHGSVVILHKLSHLSENIQWVEQLWHVVSSEPDQRCWTYLPSPAFITKQELFEKLNHHFNFLESFHYVIEFKNKIVGWVGLINNRPEHHVIEIGNVYFSHLMKQSTASTEVIYLLLKTCFEQGFRRVEWKCDALNEPSKNAALRYGFRFEGVFRQDRISKGRNRNTAWFSILDEEWRELEPAYQAWLSSSNFDEKGQQKIRLHDFKALYQLE